MWRQTVVPMTNVLHFFQILSKMLTGKVLVDTIMSNVATEIVWLSAIGLNCSFINFTNILRTIFSYKVLCKAFLDYIIFGTYHKFNLYNIIRNL